MKIVVLWWGGGGVGGVGVGGGGGWGGKPKNQRGHVFGCVNLCLTLTLGMRISDVCTRCTRWRVLGDL